MYIYLNNGSFKSEVDPHQFNLRERKKIFKSWQVCDWLAKFNRIVYGSKVAEGLSAFQRRSCYVLCLPDQAVEMNGRVAEDSKHHVAHATLL